MTREALPNRREIETFRFEHAGIKHFCSLSRYEDGRLAEVFCDAAKVGTDFQALAHDGAKLISLALQHGTPVETLSHAMERDDMGMPSSSLGKLLDMVTA